VSVSGEGGLSIEELADRAGVSVRTVRYYISQGLLRGPANRGKYASYDEDHLARLQLIRRLVDQHVPLAELRERLGHLSSEELNAVLRQEERHSRVLEQARTASSARDYVSGLLARARTPPTVPSSQRARAQPPVRRAAPSVPSHIAQPEPVQRWELAPGVELYVHSDAAQQHPQFIERLLEFARDELGRTST
jgi:DNA-binding transcriptional MerR regulator